MSINLPTTATPQLRVSPRAVPSEIFSAAQIRFGGNLPNHGAVGDRDTVATLLANGSDRDALRAALREPFSHVVELTDEGGAEGLWLGVPAIDNAFYLSLTTGTAFSTQPALLICDTLIERGALTAERRSPVELCLHEAVANGVVHGNLGIASSSKDQPDGYRVFSQLVNERLHNPEFRRRRVDIYVHWTSESLYMSVADEGGGFDISKLRFEPDGSARSGRGFLFMRALSDSLDIAPDGRCTTLRFDA